MSILISLANYYDRLKDNPQIEIPRMGYSRENIHAEIVISRAGKALRISKLGDYNDDKGIRMLVPTYPVARTSGVKSYFLWDKIEYSLGIKLEGKSVKLHNSRRGLKEHQAFVNIHSKHIPTNSNPQFDAMLKFIDSWKPEMHLELEIPSDLVSRSSFNVVFKVEGEKSYIHDLPDADNLWQSILSSTDKSTNGLCMVSGKTDVPIESKHPKFMGIGDKGTLLVSYNDPIYDSRGKKYGENASISKEIAFKYGAALRYLLEPGSTQKIRIGDTTLVFWAETSDNVTDEQANFVESLFMESVNSRDDDATANEELRVSMKKMAEGRMDKNLNPDLNPDTIVNILGISPNSARLSVRFWHRGQFGEIAKNLTEHWNDLEFADPNQNGWKNPPSIWALAVTTAIEKKSRDRKSVIQPLLIGNLLDSVLKGWQYPRNFIQAVIRRIRSEDVTTEKGNLTFAFKKRMAICKAFANREPTNNGVDLMSLDTENSQTPYLLGRLFACFAYAEKSYASRNATTCDKFISSASATPGRVFPLLFGRFQHNLSALKKSETSRGLGHKVEVTVQKIVDMFNGNYEDYPNSLSLADQALFFTGFYHQNNAFYVSKENGKEQVQESDSDS